jgi:serine/threonine protein kinase
MAAPCTTDEFLSLVAQSKLVDESALARYRQPSEGPVESPGETARLLVRDGLLTRFQAEQLLLGTYRRFVFGNYKVLDQLGTGGMAKVYLCEHQVMRHQVAIKVLPPAQAQNPSAVERFYREARAIAALCHPNIVSASDIDQADGLHFLVMEYVKGPSLLEMVIRQGPLHPQRVADYLRQAANGLQHAFEAGLVHRDIKPANLLVDPTGTLKILDLGLARFFADEEDNLSHKYDEAVLGTADYLAPEQAEDSHNVDIRADIYSLGCTFYFCLTGSPPFNQGSFTQKLIWHQTRRPRPIADFRDDVPAGLIAVIDKMMAKDRASRYQIPAEVASAVAAIREGIAVLPSWDTTVNKADGTRKEAASGAPKPRTPTPSTPRRFWWLAAGLCLLLVLAGVTIFLFMGGTPSRSPSSSAAVLSPTDRADAPRLVPALVIHCGRGMGKQQEEVMLPGYGYELLQGKIWDDWAPPATTSYAWYDDACLVFRLKVPPGEGGTLRLRFVDGDQQNRKQRLLIGGKRFSEIEDFGGAGKQLEVPVSSRDTKDGTIDVAIENLTPGRLNAVVSVVELLIHSRSGKR